MSAGQTLLTGAAALGWVCRCNHGKGSCGAPTLSWKPTYT